MRFVHCGAFLLALLAGIADCPAFAGQACPLRFETVLEHRLAGMSAKTNLSYSISCAVDREPALRRDIVGRAKRDVAAFLATKPWTQGTMTSLDIEVVARFESPRLVSLLQAETIYEGGAHERTEFLSATWDLRRHRPLLLADLLIDTKPATLAVLATAVRAGLVAYDAAIAGTGAAEPANDWTAVITPRMKNFSAWTLDEGTEAGRAAGITFHYNSYTIANYSAKAFVPLSAIAPLIKADYRSLFGGEPGRSR